jgi:F0F1-type ATP synthase delta subunit
MQKSEKLEKFLGLVSEDKSNLLEKMQWRIANKEWLERSGKIALKILRKLRENKDAQLLPSNQKELAELMQMKPQQVNRIVKGDENLTLETISRIEQALKIQLIELQVA